jgi:hypothetical protein
MPLFLEGDSVFSYLIMMLEINLFFWLIMCLMQVFSVLVVRYLDPVFAFFYGLMMVLMNFV